jgi:hypothetical protein
MNNITEYHEFVNEKNSIEEIEKWYEDLPDDKRMKLQHEFDEVYDNKGNRETKFYKWLKNKKK